MGTPALEKQPSESRLFDFDFSANLDATETIDVLTSVVATPTTSPTLDLTAPSIIVGGKGIQFRLAGGVAGSYKITAKVHTSLNNSLEAEGVLNVLDR